MDLPSACLIIKGTHTGAPSMRSCAAFANVATTEIFCVSKTPRLRDKIHVESIGQDYLWTTGSACGTQQVL